MVGKTLGHYEIIEPLGAGGMGEVYRARDTKLDRDVAIKVLPVDFATDQDRLARFEREAKLLASLNHANIATIHGLEDSDGVRFIAMELVEGETLAERIARSGPMDVDEALDIARQITEALEAAHENGVIHRDLKPANVKITPDHQVKVLDFGLAKAYEPDGSPAEISPDLSHSPTMAAATRTGVIMGTAAYMSPEHARGKPVDKRTDIWAFGCVLYEMLTGRRAFAGETISDTLAAILKEEPDWQRIPAGVPTEARAVTRRALVKDPKQRARDIGDVRIALSETMRSPAAGESVIPAPARRWTVVFPWVLAIGSTALLIASVALDPGGDSVLRGGNPLRERITFNDTTANAAISPDGQYVAYQVARCTADADCRVVLEVQDLVARGAPMEGGPAVRVGDVVRGPDYFFSVEWDQEGHEIVFTPGFSGELAHLQGVYRMPRTGGNGTAVRTGIHATSASYRPGGEWIDWIAWPNGFAGEPELTAFNVSNEQTEGHALPIRAMHHEWSPDGRWLAVIAAPFRDTGAVAILDSDFNTRDTFALNASVIGVKVRWGAGSSSLYALVGGDLIRLEVDNDGRIAGPTETVYPRLESSTWALGNFDISSNGESVVYVPLSQRVELRALEIEGDRVASDVALVSGTVGRDFVSISPDGETVAYAREERGGSEIYLRPFAGGEERALTGTGGLKTFPRWSPDGKYLAYLRYEDDGRWLAVAPVVGGQEQRLGRVFGTGTLFPRFAWRADGPQLVFLNESGTVSTIRLGGEPEELFPLPPDVGVVIDFLISPDDRQIAVNHYNYAGEDSPASVDVADLAAGDWRRVFTADLYSDFESTSHPAEMGPLGWAALLPQVWTEAGDLVVATTSRQGPRVAGGLWRVRMGVNEPELLVDYGAHCGGPTFVSSTPDLERLVCVRRSWGTDVFLLQNTGLGTIR